MTGSPGGIKTIKVKRQRLLTDQNRSSMFNRRMKEPYKDQGAMGRQEDPGPITVMGGLDDPARSLIKTG